MGGSTGKSQHNELRCQCANKREYTVAMNVWLHVAQLQRTKSWNNAPEETTPAAVLHDESCQARGRQQSPEAAAHASENACKRKVDYIREERALRVSKFGAPYFEYSNRRMRDRRWFKRVGIQRHGGVTKRFEVNARRQTAPPLLAYTIPVAGSGDSFDAKMPQLPTKHDVRQPHADERKRNNRRRDLCDKRGYAPAGVAQVNDAENIGRNS